MEGLVFALLWQWDFDNLLLTTCVLEDSACSFTCTKLGFTAVSDNSDKYITSLFLTDCAYLFPIWNSQNVYMVVRSVQHYNSLLVPTMPAARTPTLICPQHSFAISNKGTGGSFARAKCSCNNKLTMLTKLAIEKTEMERDVSLSMARRGWVM